MTMRTNPDTPLGTEFWRAHPHLFVPAHWSTWNCRCCLHPKKAAVHEVTVDPATIVENCTGYRVARAEQVLYAVIGWDDEDKGGGSCSYAPVLGYEEALAFAESLLANGDPDLSERRYQHIEIQERRYFTAVDTNVMVLS